MLFHVYDASTNLFSNSSFPLKLWRLTFTMRQNTTISSIGALNKVEPCESSIHRSHWQSSTITRSEGSDMFRSGTWQKLCLRISRIFMWLVFLKAIYTPSVVLWVLRGNWPLSILNVDHSPFRVKNKYGHLIFLVQNDLASKFNKIRAKPPFFAARSCHIGERWLSAAGGKRWPWGKREALHWAKVPRRVYDSSWPRRQTKGFNHSLLAFL